MIIESAYIRTKPNMFTAAVDVECDQIFVEYEDGKLWLRQESKQRTNIISISITSIDDLREALDTIKSIDKMGKDDGRVPLKPKE